MTTQVPEDKLNVVLHRSQLSRGSVQP